MRFAPVLLALALAFPVAAVHGETRLPDAALAKAEQLREQALASDLDWKITESLTTEVGPRLPGTEAAARAVAWAKAKFEELGYDKVWTEPVTFPKWESRGESAAVLGKHAQPLVLTALGGSPGGTVAGAVVRVADLDAPTGRAACGERVGDDEK